MKCTIIGLATSILATSAAARDPLVPEIQIKAPASGDWAVTYKLPEEARRLVFLQSPDSSRGASWAVGPEWEIIRTGEGEVLQRKDGATFRRASATVPPAYRELPKSYAPFAPFGDGGMLFHTGRFFACADKCLKEPRWKFKLAAPKERSILLNGHKHEGRATWTDFKQGTNVYVGNAQPVETAELLAIIDTTLPTRLRDQLATQLPVYMRYFSERLGSLAQKPMLFASYDTSDRERVGQQGGTLPGQVFTHFYGAAWPKKMERPGLASELTQFFAHEAAHLYQRQIFSQRAEDAWIHEGGAEAFAALATAEIDPSKDRLAELTKIATIKCTKQLQGGSLTKAIAAGSFDASYSCGMLLNLSLDRELRAANTRSEGIYGLWRQYIADVDAGAAPGEESFLGAVEKVAGRDLALRVADAIRAASGVEAMALSGT